MYMVPANDWHLEVENFDRNKLNFTWNVTHYGNGTDFMLIDLFWNDFLSISPTKNQDTIVFHIKELRNFFISETLLIDLN